MIMQVNPSIDALKAQYRQSPLPAHWWQGWLVFVLNKSSSFLITDGDYVLSDDEHARFLAGVERMQSGEPLAYLMGEQAFWGREFLVNQHTLIPRADTEMLIETVLAFVRERGLEQAKILDLGTGSGCIAITLAKELAKAQVVAVDFSESALRVAKQNAGRWQATNCTFVLSDWFDKVQGVFDVIVSNPPYIATNDEHLAALTAEPITALVSDNQGLFDIQQIIKNAGEHLSEQGLLILEHGHDQAQEVQTLLHQAGFGQIDTVQDYGGNDRVTFGVWRG